VAVAKRYSYERMLSSLYQSVSVPEVLAEFLEQLNVATQSHVSTVLMHDYATGRGSLPALIGLPADAVMDYEQRYAADNIWMARVAPTLAPGRINNSDDHVSLAELRATDFWRHYLSLADVDHCIGITGSQDARGVAQLSLLRSQRVGAYGEAELELSRRIAPHWVNACQIRNQLGTLHETVVSLEAALNRVALAVLFIDGGGKVARVNHGAERMLQGGEVVALRVGHLVARHAGDVRRLDQAIAAATRAALTPDAPLAASARMTLRDSEGVPAAFASVRPLGSGDGAHANGRQASVIVFIRSLFSDSPRDMAEALAEMFGLTPAEARLAVELHARADLALAAAAAGITIDAARSRIKLVFDKTGAHSQVALVKLVSGLGDVLATTPS
jgi:PAS domain-containing protein/DNA-binding CsgD family transcriptional regulator